MTETPTRPAPAPDAPDWTQDWLAGADDLPTPELAVLRYRNALVEQIAKAAVGVELFAYKTLLAGAPAELAHDVAAVLAARTGTFGMAFTVQPAENTVRSVTRFTVRAADDYDVLALTRPLGGVGTTRYATFDRLSPFPVMDLRVACQQAQYKADPVAALAVKLLQANRERRRDALADLRRTQPAQHKLVVEKMDELKKQANEGGF